MNYCKSYKKPCDVELDLLNDVGWLRVALIARWEKEQEGLKTERIILKK